MLQVATTPTEDAIVLDFFAGSAPTAHATVVQNGTDGGNRRFICVQFPEPLPRVESKLRTITDIGTERVRSLAQAKSGNGQGELTLDARADVGFRFYRLTTIPLS